MDFVPVLLRTSQVKVRIASLLTHCFMSIIKFKYCKHEGITVIFSMQML